jgi:hypothetical protein
MAKHITIRLTPRQARVLFEIVDGAADAGACEGGLTKDESRALGSVTEKLMAERALWQRHRRTETPK